MNIHHIYCADHVLHLTCKICYEKEEIFGDAYSSIEKARKLVSYFNKSTQALEKLKTSQELLVKNNSPKGIVNDVVTRWWSTYDMIERLLVLKPAINYMGAEGQLGGNDPFEKKRLGES